eukprot:1929299-Prymnesium_polylepis.1
MPVAARRRRRRAVGRPPRGARGCAHSAAHTPHRRRRGKGGNACSGRSAGARAAPPRCRHRIRRRWRGCGAARTPCTGR